jgi:hypothetical protein
VFGRVLLLHKKIWIHENETSDARASSGGKESGYCSGAISYDHHAPEVETLRYLVHDVTN